MTKYVLGFAFSEQRGQVLLISKTHPKWQYGKLNGVGGHIEEGESPKEAMVREFAEEVGIHTRQTDWKYFAFMTDYKSWECYCFRSFDVNIFSSHQKTDEKPTIVSIEDLRWQNIIDNIPTIVMAALDEEPHLMTLSYGKQP